MRYEVGTRLFYIDGLLSPVPCTIVEKLVGSRESNPDRIVCFDRSSDTVRIPADGLWYGEKIAKDVHRCRVLLQKIRGTDDQRHKSTGGEFGIGEAFWCEKIRFWEDRVPSRVQIVSVYSKAYDDHERWIYAHSDEYGHPVYLERARCFFLRASAVRTSLVRTIEHDLRHESDIEYIMTLSKRS